MSCHPPSNTQRKQGLEALLLRYRYLWQPAPFRIPTPGWCSRHAGLAEKVLALDEAAVPALRGDDAALIRLVADAVPEVAGLAALIDLPMADTTPLPAVPARLFRDMRGRKQAQIEAYAAALDAPHAPLLEWCAGKGHLGRLLAHAWQVPVHSLEIDPALCADGRSLAMRAQLQDAQTFLQRDALHPESGRLLAGRRGVALHACGDLHRTLVRAAAEQASPALDVAPCCYYRTAAPLYRPFMPTALQLTRDDLHLAVNDTVTAAGREQRLADQARAWKLAFQVWCRTLGGTADYRPMKPVPPAWLRDGFPAWCRHLAMREGLSWQDPPDWTALEAEGWLQAARVRRLELVRLAFRRALEVWLLMDMAVFLENAGYRVRVTQFCRPALTPRNLLLSATRL